jgi:flagellar biosynthesis/type III secretory pathway chaperone
MRPDTAELVDNLNQIIKEQSDIISELFRLLSQHISVEELDNLKVVEDINEIARRKNSLGRFSDL